MSKNIKKIVKKNARFFFWGMRFLPKAKREAMYTLYVFFKHIDEIIDNDNDMPMNEKVELINAWREEFNNIYDKKVPATEIGRKIYKNCMRFKLPKSEFLKLIDSLAMDIPTPLVAPSFEKFLKYSRGSAGTPINLSLRVLGVENEKLIEEISTDFGNAIKITTVLRDIKEDAQAGHIYIPKELLEEAEVFSTVPLKIVTDKNLVFAREAFATVNKQLYENSYILIDQLDKTTARHIRSLANVYKRYFDIMNNRGWEVISPKPKVGKMHRMSLILKSFFYKKA